MLKMGALKLLGIINKYFFLVKYQGYWIHWWSIALLTSGYFFAPCHSYQEPCLRNNALDDWHCAYYKVTGSLIAIICLTTYCQLKCHGCVSPNLIYKTGMHDVLNICWQEQNVHVVGTDMHKSFLSSEENFWAMRCSMNRLDNNSASSKYSDLWIRVWRWNTGVPTLNLRETIPQDLRSFSHSREDR